MHKKQEIIERIKVSEIDQRLVSLEKKIIELESLVIYLNKDSKKVKASVTDYTEDLLNNSQKVINSPSQNKKKHSSPTEFFFKHNFNINNTNNNFINSCTN